MRLLACTLLVIATAHAGLVCEPDSFTDDGITFCFCIGDGMGYICAPSDHRAPKSIKDKREIAAVEETCEPGKFFKNYCNTCHCGSDGRMVSSVCTMMACDENVWNKDGTLKHTEGTGNNPILRKAREIQQNQDTCEPGKKFNYYCNTCFCGPDGLVIHSACTRMACDHRFVNKDGTLKESVKVEENPLANVIFDKVKSCEPGQSFKHYCNSCMCGEDGLAACTEMYCDPNVWNRDGTLKDSVKVVESPEVQICEPGKTYKEYCNTCTCGKDGFLSACTDMYCDPNVWNRDGTLKDSVKVVESPEVQTCEPGKTYKEYCNTCTCGKDGFSSACTKMYCDPNVWNRDGTLKIHVEENQDTCEPGKSFKYYCNTCICGPEGKVAQSACTRKGCGPFYNKDGSLKLPNEILNNPLLRQTREVEDNQDTCEPGKSFKYYCNTCFCGPEGKVAQSACTRKACGPFYNKDGSVKLPNEILDNPLLRQTREVEDNQDTCEPGKSFKYYCNTCICGPEGKVAQSACTRKGCGPFYNKDGSLKLPNEILNNPLLRQTREVEDNQDTCEPGKSFKYYCNTCFCGPEGKVAQSACTRKGCGPFYNKDGSLKLPNEILNNPLLRQTREVEDNQDTCEPGKSFKYYCNTCFCGPEGKVAQSACTRKACGPFYNKDGSVKLPNEILDNPLLRQTREVEGNQDTCEPGKSFKHYCNTCFCGPEGLVMTSACTRMACNRDIWNKDGSLKIEVGSSSLMRKERSTNFLCQPGKVYKDECNTCTCTKDGKSAACTLMACEPSHDGRAEAPQVCEPRKNFMIECNHCMCNEDGTRIACTKMLCRKAAKRSVCEPNSTFNQDCNVCRCNEDGTAAACTEKGCLLPLKKKVCEPNSTFKNDCNTCTCNEDGTNAICTLKACLGPLKKKVCEPNSTFKKDCNTCTCNEDGTRIACTKMLCRKAAKRSVCEPNSTFNQDCNVCRCNEDGTAAACTEKGCLLPLKKKVCEPNSTFKNDCNTCTCNEDGTNAICTLKACLGPLKKKVCEPNSTFKNDCNTCTCNEDGTNAICTLKACLGPLKKKVCEPNSTFKKDCNTCTCNEDGTNAACTLKACLEPLKKRVCEPNSTFQKDCNTCTCNADGTNAACTLKGCLEPLKKKVCEPNSTYKPDSCNSCTCNNDGTSAICTLMECVN